jgi:hypothetical protein
MTRIVERKVNEFAHLILCEFVKRKDCRESDISQEDRSFICVYGEVMY